MHLLARILHVGFYCNSRRPVKGYGASRMLKKFTVLTHPAPARQDAPFHRQDRSE
jgi:hypothetical protein